MKGKPLLITLDPAKAWRYWEGGGEAELNHDYSMPCPKCQEMTYPLALLVRKSKKELAGFEYHCRACPLEWRVTRKKEVVDE